MAKFDFDTEDGTEIGNPSAGNYYIFLDSSNSDSLTLRDSAGVDTVFTAGVIPTILNDLTDVTISSPVTGQKLEFDGANWVNANPAVYGTNLRIDEVAGPLTTTLTAPQDIINTTLASIEAGDYALTVSYGWNHDANNNDFEGYVTFDGTLLGDPFGNGFTHKQEPQDSGGGGGGSGTDQQYAWEKTFYLPGLSAGTKDLLIQYSTSSGGDESTVWNIMYKLIRIA